MLRRQVISIRAACTTTICRKYRATRRDATRRFRAGAIKSRARAGLESDAPDNAVARDLYEILSLQNTVLPTLNIGDPTHTNPLSGATVS